MIYALLDASDSHHAEALGWYERVDSELVTTPLVLAEADHLALSRGGDVAARSFRSDVRRMAYRAEWWPSAAAQATDIADRYETLGLGLTDASLVALAARVQTIDIATFDERHFRVVTPLTGGPAFRILPTDSIGPLR